MKLLQILFIILSFLIINILTLNEEENTSDNKEEQLTGLNIEKYKKLISKLKSNDYKKIVFLTGAGVSTAAGIPDFRSKGGIFEQLQLKYNLPTPEDFFSIDVFQNRPEYFYEFLKNFKPENYSPTIFHYLMGYISSKKKLHYAFTQNIDGLDSKCGINKEKLVYAHGNFENAHCPSCEKRFNMSTLRKYIDKGEIMYCDRCGGPVKPLITFYGEPLLNSFFRKSNTIDEADIVIICGTSLLVTPFNELPDKADRKAIRLFINKDEFPKEIYGLRPFGFDDEESNDIFFKGECDNAAIKIVKDAGWEDDFYKFVEKTKKEEEDKNKNGNKDVVE